MAPEEQGGPTRLLEVDPELGQLMDDERRERAEHALRVRMVRVPTGEWDCERLAGADPLNLGLLIAAGVVSREVVLAENVSSELLGPGDIVRPWSIDGPQRLLSVAVRWNALSDVTLALIDRRTMMKLGEFPEIGAVIIDRVAERARRLAVTQAISQLNRVDRRLLALFWHLAERWGRVGRDGVAIPLALSHRLIGELVGARRPTISTALAQLAASGELRRRPDGTWLLTGEPIAAPEVSGAEVIRQRRRLMPAAAEPPAPPEEESERINQMQAAFAVAIETSQEQRRQLGVLLGETLALQARSTALRTERIRRMEALRAAAAARRG